jgi:hypothetical protein
MIVENRTGDGPTFQAGPPKPSRGLPKVAETVPRYILDEELARLMGPVRKLPCPFQRAALLVGPLERRQARRDPQAGAGVFGLLPRRHAALEDSSRQDLLGEDRAPRAASVVRGSAESRVRAFGFRQVGAGGLLIGPVPEFANNHKSYIDPYMAEVRHKLDSLALPPGTSDEWPVGLTNRSSEERPCSIYYFCCAASILLFACNIGSLIPNSFSAFSPSIFRLAVSLRNGKSYIALGNSKSW